MLRLPTAPSLVAALLVLTPSLLPAQRIAPPCSSSVWSAGSSRTEADSARRTLAREGWTQSKGATAGGVIGALVGMSAGLLKCRLVGAYSGTRCGGDMAWGAALFGGVGLLLGSLAGADAEQHGH